MEVISTVADLRDRLHAESSVALVPTMGNLHDGHLALVRLARAHGKCVAASIFVNPLQFGPGEDFAQYPRTLDGDLDKLKKEGVDLVFTPSTREMYPVPQSVTVEPPPAANFLCGPFRPGHFRGVATVVLKLFNVVRPQAAVFGKKDYQQLFIVREMVQQLNLPVAIVEAETERAPDGLALSSRNAYLNQAERLEAPRLYQNMLKIREMVRNGNLDFDELVLQARRDLTVRGWKVDYVALHQKRTLEPANPGDRGLIVLGAAWLANTRLIDNLEID